MSDEAKKEPRRWSVRRWVALVVAAGLFVVGGAFGAAIQDDDKGPKLADEQPTTTVEADDDGPSTSEATTTTEPEPDEFVVGDAVETSRGNVVTVYAYEQPVAPPQYWPVTDGAELAAIDVEGCNKGDSTLSLNPFDFELVMGDNTRRDSEVGLREPALNYTEVGPGECVRGWATFEVPVGQRPIEIVDINTEPTVKWKVPAA